MSTYIHELPDWAQFHTDGAKLAGSLAEVRHRQGRLIGQMEGLGFRLRQDAIFKTLTSDVLKTSEIEGERLDVEQVRSSIARKLGIDIGALKASDRHVDGVVEMMLDATRKYDKPLTKDRLFGWHAALFPTGRSGMAKIRVGEWRKGPMEVVSGAIGRERVHYEAPLKVKREMDDFLDWFNTTSDEDQVLKAARAHFWFVTVHPFDDGNGRIARAIADMTLARSEGSSQRFYSMSAQIRLERKAYYKILEQTQKGPMDITPWMEWFLGCMGRAIDNAQTALASVLAKARFWEAVAEVSLNDRQRTMLNRLTDGIEGPMTNAKWAKMTKCSADTALRDLQYLVDQGVLTRGEAGGRSSSYLLLQQPDFR